MFVGQQKRKQKDSEILIMCSESLLENTEDKIEHPNSYKIELVPLP